MAWRTPPSLVRFCREVLPLLCRETNGKALLKVVAGIVETDRWNSFDRFHKTTGKLVDYYRSAGARAEVHPIQTGGRIGSGRWIIHEAADVCRATVDVVHPVRRRVLDYNRNPWHVIQWSASTPRHGTRSELVILDSKEALEGILAGGLSGKMVLTKMLPSDHVEALANRGASGVITDYPVPGLPDVTAWVKFGWGGLPFEKAAANLVGLVLSETEGRKLRDLTRSRGVLTLHTTVDIRKYVGTHDVVSGLIPGRDDPQDEVWAMAHTSEPGALATPPDWRCAWRGAGRWGAS